MALDRATYDLIADCLSLLETHRDQLNNFEIDFLTGKGPEGQYPSMQEKFEEYGEEMRISPKQVQVLQRMYDKVINGIEPFKRR